jgi:hypothetical protein
MPDTGSPWNLPFPSDTELVRNAPDQFEDLANATASGLTIAASNASLLTTGTVANARLSGSYTGVTGTGALNAGSITSGFGNVNIGTSTFTGNGSGLTTLNASNLSSGTVAKARLPSGSSLQVVQTIKTDTFSTTSTSYVNITGMSVTITPSSATSKILIIAYIVVGLSDDFDNGASVRVTGGNLSAFIADASGSVNRGAWTPGRQGGSDLQTIQQAGTIVVLDSPNTTSATTYQLTMRRGLAGTAFVNRNGTEEDKAAYSRSVSTITAIEVAG